MYLDVNLELSMETTWPSALLRKYRLFYLRISELRAEPHEL
jgi:hypothetical protein